MTAPSFFRVSRTALLARLGERIDLALPHRIARLVDLLDASGIDGVRDVVPAYTTVNVEYDNAIISASEMEERLRQLWAEADVDTSGDESTGRAVDIPVAYGGAHGVDLENVAARAHLTADEVTRRHAAIEYTVGALGFAPGFAYLIGLPDELATPRRARPRLSVPPGSVGIGGVQTGIYALPTPGGWSLIGQTPLRLFAHEREEPFLLRMGDRVRFLPISAEEFAGWPREEEVESEAAREGDLEILASGLQTSVQDLGRPGHGRYGVSPGGAADRASLVAANRLAGNPDDAAALEITLAGPHIRFRRATVIALAGADLGARLNGRPLAAGERARVIPGDELTFAPAPDATRARAYLAVAGGIDVPVVMGSRSTDLTAGFGGYQGRALRAGDRLRIGQARRSAPAPSIRGTRIGLERPYRVVRGPQADRFAPATWRRFLNSSFTVTSESNRVGLRLAGPSILPVDNADIISEGIVTGSIQITGEGQPIVMLPAHATIGGYTKIATVIEEDRDRLGQLRPGDVVRFREVFLDLDAPEPEGWGLNDLVRLAREAASRDVDAFAFEERASGARLRLIRREPM